MWLVSVNNKINMEGKQQIGLNPSNYILKHHNETEVYSHIRLYTIIHESTPTQKQRQGERLSSNFINFTFC